MGVRNLLITASTDKCSDWHQSQHGNKVLRLNADQPQMLDLEISEEGFYCFGMPLASFDSVYWRKPFLPEGFGGNPELAFEQSQRRYALKSLAREACRSGKWLMVDPSYEAAVPRPVQLLEAARTFSVPRWQISDGSRIRLDDSRVVKALTAVSVDGKHFLSTQRIPPGATLSASNTWYVQDCIDASHDVTVLFCCGRMWAFELDRGGLRGEVDWRLFGDNHRSESWSHIELSKQERLSVEEFMRRLGLHFGRLDFLRDGHGSLWFLEVNPNGQFGWLDPSGDLGMHAWIFDCALARPDGWGLASN